MHLLLLRYQDDQHLSLETHKPINPPLFFWISQTSNELMNVIKEERILRKLEGIYFRFGAAEKPR